MAVGVNEAEEAVKKLLEWYRDKEKMAESRDSMGCTPLHSAVDGDSCFTHVKLLIDWKKMDIKAEYEMGRTALVLYIQKLGQAQSLSDVGGLAALKQTLDDLLDSGISAKIKDQDGKSAIDYATQANLTWAFEKLNSVFKRPENSSEISKFSPGASTRANARC